MSEAWPEQPATLPGGAPVLTVDGFEGPLDFLLEMARAQRIDLRRLSVLAIVEALARALEAALADETPVDLTRWGEWLGMGAHLALLRSRLLLPPDAPEARAAQAEADALRARLLERELVRQTGAWLDARAQVGRDVFLRGVIEQSGAVARGADVTALFMACLVALRVDAHGDPYAPPPPPLWRVSDAVERMTRRLSERPEGGRLASFVPVSVLSGPERELRCRAAVASTLVAGLELSRGGAVTLRQDEREIWVARGAGPD